MEKITASIIGASGLVGHLLLEQLVSDEKYNKIHAFTRKPLGLKHDKIINHVIDFDTPSSWMNMVQGDVLFSCMGTTLKTAGSKEAQYTVDYTYPYRFAGAAAQNGVKQFVLISSIGADAESKVFYTRMKGELDRDVASFPFDRISILRPSFLDGDRKESRTGERFGIFLSKLISPFIPPLKKYRPIEAAQVAAAMRKVVIQQTESYQVYEAEELFTLADEK